MRLEMDKLIELLNEHEELSPSRIQRKYYQENGHIMYIDKEGEDVDDYRTDYEIISKSCGFIKWLVENDKIDLGKLIMIKDEEQKAIIDIDNSRENTLLMLLAIQDEPIKFLTEILKTERQYTEEEQELLDLDYGIGYTKKFVK